MEDMGPTWWGNEYDKPAPEEDGDIQAKLYVIKRWNTRN